jgi:tape measure domain-containing protein
MSDVFRILAEIQLQVAGKPELDKLDAQIKNVTADQKTLNATAAALTKEIAATNSLAQKQVLTTALKNTEAQLAKTTAEAKKLAGVIDQPQKKGGLFDLSTILNFSAGNIAANVIGNIAGAVKNFGAGIVDAAGRFEQYQIQLNTLFKSADIGKKVFDDLLKTATETPFAFSELTELTARLAAYGVEDFNIIPTIETLGNIAAGVGKENLPQLVLAFGQVRAAGKLMGTELRQFSEAGVPLTELLAKSLGKVQGEVRQLITDGKIGFADVEKALRSTTEAGGQFFDLMKRQSQTTLGAFSNFGDAVEQLQAAIGANTNGIIKDLTVLATNLVNATKDFINGDVVEKIQAEQSALNGLVGAINLTANSTLNLNEKNQIRNSLIADLRAQYPSFLAGLKDEEITTANLNILLDANNKLYSEKLRIARQDIIVQGANKELADAELVVIDKLVAANKALADFNQLTGKSVNISDIKEADKAIKAVQDRIKQGKGDLSSLEFSKLQNSFTELKRALGTTLFGTTLTDAEKEVNAASERLTQIQKIQTTETAKGKDQLQKEIAEIDRKILVNEELLQGNISSIEKKGLVNRIATLKVAKQQIENTLNPKQGVSTAPAAYDAKAVKDAEKAQKKALSDAQKAAQAIKDLQLKTAKDLQDELVKLANETEQLRTKDGTKTESQLTKQNQLEAAAAKERINTLKKEISDKKALTPELSKLFGDVSGAIDAKFKVKLDIDIDNLRAEIKALQLKISDEITTMQAEARAEQIKIELSTATNDLAGEQKRLALGTELVQAEQAKRLSELQKAGNAKAAEIEKSNLTETQKADAIAQYKAVQAINEQNVIEQSDNEKLALQVAYYEKLAAINIGYLQDITATADEETQAQINALNVQYLQGVLNYEAYKEQLDTLTKERTLAVLGEQRYETEQIIKEKQKEIAAIKAAIDAENFLRVSRGQTPLPLDSKEVQALLDQITELQKKLNEIAGSTTQAEVDIKVSKIEDLNKSVKDATAALDDPTGFLVDKLFGEGIGDAAKEKVVGAINEAFAFGKELAQQIVDEKLASIDSDSEAIQRRIDAELQLKNVNTERVEQERQTLENLQNKREQIQKRQIAANNLQRISTLALATAQAILAINATAAETTVASPIVIPLVVAAIGLGIAASLIPILGAGEDGDVSISPSGNRKPKGKSDTMLYWVNPNESIINARATQKYKPLLEMINSGASDKEIAKQLNPQEANYNTTANVSYFHKFGVTNTQKGSLNHAITEQINVTIKPLSDSLNEVTKATRRQERQQAQTNEILNDIGELLNTQTLIMKTSKKRTF